MEQAIATITTAVSYWIDKFLSLFSALCSNGLFIALISAWFTVHLQSLRLSFKEYIEMLKKHIFFARSCIFLMEQNYLWISLVANSNISADKMLNQVKRPELYELSYQAPLDKMVIRIISMYEEGLTAALSGIMLSPNAKKKNFFLDSLKKQTQAAISCLETCIEVYENSLDSPFDSFIHRFRPLDEEQLGLQERLKELAQEGHISIFQEKNKNSKQTSNPKETA